jgi:NADH-quinone oxidoreductase subunit L
VILFNTFGTLRYSELFSDPELLSENAEAVKWATLCIFGGAVGKSAQFPLHVWLPDAMEGPTTVSALIHAATMVKAGVFLVARSYPLIVHSPDTAIYIAVTGGVTAFIAASMAMVMYDIKRVLAYSTISQLGYMFLGLGAGAWAVWHATEHGLEVHAQGYTAGLFHLMNHAFFKALLFLGSGAVIHAVHTQDMREMGGLRKAMPITSTAMGLGVLSIAGVPFFSGFWSKDEILEAVHHNWGAEGIFGVLWWLGLLTAAMTAFYMTRLWMMTFSGPASHVVEEVIPSDNHSDSGNWEVLKKEVKIEAHEAPQIMTIPLIILAFLAVFSGFAVFLGEGFGSVVFYGTHHSSEGPIQWGLLDHILLSSLTHLSVLVGLTGVILGYLFYKRGDEGQTSFSTVFVSDNVVTSSLHTFLSNRMYMARLFDWVGMRTWDALAMACDWFDRNIIDGIVNGIASITQIFSGQVRKLTSGFTGHYASLTIGGLGALVVVIRVLFPLMGWSR